MQEVNLHVHIEAPPKPFGGVSVTKAAGGAKFTAPKALTDCQFPVAEQQFDVANVTEGPQPKWYPTEGAGIAAAFAQRRNTVVYSYGARGTTKRPALFGTAAAPQSGLAAQVLADVMKAPASGAKYELLCFGLGSAENLTDFLDASNQQAVIVESAREGPRLTELERRPLRTPDDAKAAAATIATNYEKHFAAVMKQATTAEEEAMPPYNGTTMGLVLYRYDTEEAFESRVESNSLHFYAMADCERPVLCGVDTTQLQAYEKAQQNLGAVCGVLSAIRCSRLRIPFGKTKFTALMKRTFNAEKNNENAKVNKPTLAVALLHVLNDEGSAEEAFHTLTTARRIGSTVGGSIVGPPTRDLAVEKWRIEQDIVELKDELAIAKAVYDYRPCIYDQPKPVQNIQEEENKRVKAILNRRQESRDKAREEMKAEAQKEAQAHIAKLEKESGRTLKELEAQLAAKREENKKLQDERAKKMAEYNKHLDKIRRKKEEEETAVEKLREEIKTLEADLASRQEMIQKKKTQLDAASANEAQGREAIIQEREETRKRRAGLYEERRAQRAEWLQEIKATNEKLLAQVAALSKLRHEKAARDGTAPDAVPEDEQEESVKRDIASIDEYLPKLISLDDVPADADATETIRKQLEEYFAQEKAEYKEKVKAEQARLGEVQQHVETFRTRIEDLQAKQRKEMLADAMKKDSHLQSLVDQVMQYLQHGLRMCKVSRTGNIRRRFFYLSDDCKRIHACELDDNGMPINRRRPSTTVFLKDVNRVVLGTYTSSFVHFASENNLRPARNEAMRDTGTYNPEQTAALTPVNLGRYNYRAFGFELASGKTLELVAETDSDCEAWLVALKRLFNFKTPFEVRVERKTGRQTREAQCPIAWGAPLSLEGRTNAPRLASEEAQFCAAHHIPPQLFLKAKDNVVVKSQNAFVTVYDVRMVASLDLLRAQYLHEFFVEHGIIPPVA